METSRPRREQLERMVLAATRAPSADNCQPFRFHWEGGELSVRLDPVRARHAIDFGHHASRLTLGGVLEALALGASAERLETRVRLSVQEPPGAVWARCRFHDSHQAPDALASALHLRATDRRFFQGGSLAHPVFAALQREAERHPGVGLHLTGRFSEELVEYLARADAYVWRHEAVYRDIIEWIRFSRAEVEATRDGIPWTAFGLPLPEWGVLRLSRAARVARLVPLLGIQHASRPWVARHLASSAAVVCLTVREPGPEALVSAGRLLLSTWVRLNHAGHGVQPLGIQSLQLYGLAQGGLAPGTRPEFNTLFSRGRDVVSRAFGLGADELPVWMFRTGLSPPLPADLRTRRLPLERLLTWGA